MADDLCNDCDCGDCDCGCFDCDCNCNCADCFPVSNVFLFIFCIPPTKTNGGNKTNSGDASLDCCCCCFCCHGQQRQSGKKKKKKGCCCWRLWCCFVRNEPSPPPSPPLPRRDGRYPMSEDLDLHMNDRWGRRHETDMGYRLGMKYPVPEEMHMYRDKDYGHGSRWNESGETRNDYRSNERYGIHKDMLSRSKENYHRRVERDAHKASLSLSYDKEKESSGERIGERNKTREEKLVSFDLQKENKEKLELGQHRRITDQNSRLHGQINYEKGDGDKKYEYGVPHQDQKLPSRWSTPTKYEEP